MARTPVVAGQFYNGTREGLISEIEDCFTGTFGPGRLPELKTPKSARHIMGLVSPHAGYVYSGGAAAWAYDALAADAMPEIAVILGPNHYGLGPAAALSDEDEWVTPLGTLHVDNEIAEAIQNISNYCKTYELAHAREHSIEVQLPFLQYLAGDAIRIVPISLAHMNIGDALAMVDDLGHAIAEAIRGKNAIVIASSDFTHYESKTAVDAKDALAIKQILNLDAHGLVEVAYSRDITMCGVIATAVMIDACVKLKASKASKLVHYTSGDITGDSDQVVGYAAISVSC